MNQLGSTARNYYRDYLPGRYASISDPQKFFSQLGQRLEHDVTSLALALAGPDIPEETYLQKVGRLNMARSQATEQVLAAAESKAAALTCNRPSHSALTSSQWMSALR
jgi:hypothetical protein